jgi:CheY-like chemotaxis protein
MQRARGTVRNVRGDNGTRTLGIAFTEPVLALGDPGREADPVGPEGIEPTALVIDDDPGVRQVLQRFLTRRGLQVTAVPSAEEGLELLRKEQPALMMLDLRMDGMTGVQLLEQMKAEGLRATHVWAMSGISDDDEALAALSTGASEFVNKPFDLDHLDYCLQLIAPVL